MRSVFAVIAGLAVAASALDLHAPAVRDEVIAAVNADPTSTWKAGRNPRLEGMTVREVKRLLGTRRDPEAMATHARLPKYAGPNLSALPSDFDSRSQWPTCTVISYIRDQSDCGSCWAVSSTATFQDRLCIETKGSFNTLLSTQDTTSCCGGFACFGSDGCNGGQPAEAWSWFQSTGVVTGGEYIDMGTGKTCYPYALAECAHHTTNSTYPPCPAQEDPTPACSTSCTDPKYPTPFKNDAHFAKQSYSLNSVNDMMSDLVTNGPITVAFDVYEDFLSYTSGVYQHKTGQYLGGHAVELIGYGTENGTPYWLIKNSWNTSWGANGLFKIIRGRDECGIEDSAVSGL